MRNKDSVNIRDFNPNINGDKNKVNFNIKNITKDNKTIINISVILIIAIFLIIGTRMFLQSPQKKIIGTWEMSDTGGLYEFTKDGRFIYLSGSNEGATITYSIDNNRLQLNISVLWANCSVFADIKFSGDILTLSNFADPDDVFGVDEDDIWTFKKAK